MHDCLCTDAAARLSDGHPTPADSWVSLDHAIKMATCCLYTSSLPLSLLLLLLPLSLHFLRLPSLLMSRRRWSLTLSCS